jgi:hypothetical protein
MLHLQAPRVVSDLSGGSQATCALAIRAALNGACCCLSANYCIRCRPHDNANALARAGKGAARGAVFDKDRCARAGL